MAHLLDFSKGRAAVAYRGATPWHGLGNVILPQDSLHDIQIKGGLDYTVERAVAQYRRQIVDVDGSVTSITAEDPNTHILYRSDTGAPLSTVSPKYNIVQPFDVVEFYQDLTERHGFQLEVVGALRGGRKVWALANTHNASVLRDGDVVKGYLLLATSYDGTMSTQARFTSVRVVCNNTLTVAANQGRADVTVSHSTKFDASKVKLQLNIGDAWAQFSENAERMQNHQVTREDTVRLFMAAYHNITSDDQLRELQEDKSKNASVEKLLARLTDSLFNSPGAQLASARGTLWGALNAVTHDVDFALPSRSSDTRLDKAWFGDGDTIKRRALAYATQAVS